jgi:tetratricopeptide (TPR) repeat protein
MKSDDIEKANSATEVGHHDEAIEAYKKAIEPEPRNDRYFNEKLTRVYEQAGKPDLATKKRKEADPGAAMVGKIETQHLRRDRCRLSLIARSFY